MKLLFRFYDINSGLITIDNQDIAEVCILLLAFKTFDSISIGRWIYKVHDQEVQIRVSNATYVYQSSEIDFEILEPFFLQSSSFVL